VGRYRITVQARRQIDDIFEYGFAAFGEYQAVAYHVGLERTFGLLADFPGMAPRAEGLRRPMRRFRFQAHHIYYSEEKGFIAIRAILHYAQDWRRGSFS
jgi:toxin ParE1/3/4